MNISGLLANPQYPEKYILQKLLMEYMKITREQMWTDGDTEISNDLLDKILIGYKAYVEDKKPLEYILGHVTFFGNEFIVNENTLVPRPETEYMIQAITEYIQGKTPHHDVQTFGQNVSPSQSSNILMDIGTGCGVLGISTLLQNNDYFQTAFFTDFSQEALLVAKKNADILLKDNKQEMFFIWSDLLSFSENYKSFWTEKNQDNDIILVANLPYIPEDMFVQNSPDNVQKREPKMAFVGGDDGLIYYRKMLDEMSDSMKSKTTFFFEMMTRQVEILAKSYPDYDFEEVKTFHFNIRIVKARYKG